MHYARRHIYPQRAFPNWSEVDSLAKDRLSVVNLWLSTNLMLNIYLQIYKSCFYKQQPIDSALSTTQVLSSNFLSDILT